MTATTIPSPRGTYHRATRMASHHRASISEQDKGLMASTVEAECISVRFVLGKKASPSQRGRAAIVAEQDAPAWFGDFPEKWLVETIPPLLPPDWSEPIQADTDVPMTIAQMAEAFDRLGRATSQEEIGLDVDLDDYPLF